MALRFDGKVAIVTGAGNGLGRSYALEMAKRGCAIVVNDLGGGLKGESAEASAPRPADVVVSEIKALGGSAVANYDSVEFGEKIVATALEAYGHVDIVINNAGILRDKTFKRMPQSDWDMIMKVHIAGVQAVTKAAWTVMLEQGYGRIVNVSSPAGLYGNRGQANYSTAKMGMVGFTQTLAKEGGRNNVHANCIAPVAGTRMLASVFPPEFIAMLKVDHITSLVVYLCHDSCQENGGIFECSGGVYQKVKLARSVGWTADLSKGDPSVEDVAANIGVIADMEGHIIPDTDEVGSRDGINNVMAHAKL